ncbi:MAG TPA: c-type cytochrome domain-containing protein [Verrucomicrobiae bacterium]
MRSFRLTVLASLLAWFAASVPAQAQKSGEVSFSRDIAPILVAKCQTCHGAEKAKGKYRLHNFEWLVKPGSSGEAAITPGDPKKSTFYSLLVEKDPDSRMPQKDDPLPAAQIALVERWIKNGAKFDGADPKLDLVSLMPRKQHPAPPEIYPQPLPVTALAFSTNGQQLITSGYHEIIVWDIATLKPVKRIRNVAAEVSALSLSPDGTLLAAATGQSGKLGEVLLIPLDKPEPKVLVTLPDVVLDVKFSPDGKLLASGGSDNAIRIFDVATGKEVRKIEQHANWVMAIAWSPDGKGLASASRDKTTRAYDATTGEMHSAYMSHEEPVFGVTFADGTNHIASVGRDRKLHLWKAEDGKVVKDSRPLGGFGGEIWRLLGSGTNLITADKSKEIRVYIAQPFKWDRTFNGHNDWVQALALSPDGKTLASGGHDGEVILWNFEDKKILQRFIASPGCKPGVAKVK